MPKKSEVKTLEETNAALVKAQQELAETQAKLEKSKAALEKSKMEELKKNDDEDEDDEEEDEEDDDEKEKDDDDDEKEDDEMDKCNSPKKYKKADLDKAMTRLFAIAEGRQTEDAQTVDDSQELLKSMFENETVDAYPVLEHFSEATQNGLALLTSKLDAMNKSIVDLVKINKRLMAKNVELSEMPLPPKSEGLTEVKKGGFTERPMPDVLTENKSNAADVEIYREGLKKSLAEGSDMIKGKHVGTLLLRSDRGILDQEVLDHIKASFK